MSDIVERLRAYQGHEAGSRIGETFAVAADTIDALRADVERLEAELEDAGDRLATAVLETTRYMAERDEALGRLDRLRERLSSDDTMIIERSTYDTLRAEVARLKGLLRDGAHGPVTEMPWQAWGGVGWPFGWHEEAEGIGWPIRRDGETQDDEPTYWASTPEAQRELIGLLNARAALTELDGGDDA